MRLAIHHRQQPFGTRLRLGHERIQRGPPQRRGSREAVSHNLPTAVSMIDRRVNRPSLIGGNTQCLRRRCSYGNPRTSERIVGRNPQLGQRTDLVRGDGPAQLAMLVHLGLHFAMSRRDDDEELGLSIRPSLRIARVRAIQQASGDLGSP